MKPFTVFLFEQIMIFSETVGKKTQFTSPVYVYKAHFLVRKANIFSFFFESLFPDSPEFSEIGSLYFSPSFSA